MQATQSSTAWESGSSSGKFAALRHVTRTMKLGGDVALIELEQASVAAAGGIAEGAGLAHDAGNLLGALSLYSDLLALPGVLREEHQAYAAELRLLSDRSWAMINRLVNHAREEQSSRTETQVTLLPEVVERCRGLLSKVAGHKVEVLYGEGAYEPVAVPAESVERIITNLVKNAAEAMPWVGAITVSVAGVGERDGVRRRVVMTVRDRGCGMDVATAQGLMEAGGISPSGGRGLGFRVVRELVAMSGGCVTIESEVDVGTSISAEWYALEEFEGRSFEGQSLEEQGMNVVMQRDVRSIAC